MPKGNPFLISHFFPYSVISRNDIYSFMGYDCLFILLTVLSNKLKAIVH